jgi:hypothetical protein
LLDRSLGADGWAFGLVLTIVIFLPLLQMKLCLALRKVHSIAVNPFGGECIE